MHRFFVDEENIADGRVSIGGDDFSHINLSLRLREGDRITVCTGDKKDHIVELTDFYSDYVEGKILETKRNSAEPDLDITLAQSLPKNRNMELVVQKMTEIGGRAIIPLETERTIVKLSGKKKVKRHARWQKIVAEAAKQSGRGIIPEVKSVTDFSDLLDRFSEYDLVIAFWTGEKEKGLRNILSGIGKDKIGSILLMIGPEGGFSPQEAKLIRKQGGYTCGLGPRILRTETAGPVGTAILLYEFGEMGV